MNPALFQRHFVAVMAKHLPPSSSTLRLLDLDGRSGPLLAELRADLQSCHITAEDLRERDIAPCSVDAVVAFDLRLSDAVLEACLRALRAGGRLIALDSRGTVDESHLRRLRARGYVRILVEPALDELGTLVRGEKPHATDDTLERVQAVARADADSLDLSQFSGRYIHFLVQQRPNKPAWKLEKGESVTWRAAAISGDSTPTLLGFSSLPKAVAFMQTAVLAGKITDINKVGKFSRATARTQEWDIVMNPAPASIDGTALAYIVIDPALAEAPDE